MRKPKMIIFDAGKTLIDYFSEAGDKGTLILSTCDASEKLMKYIISNPSGYDASTINRVNNEIFERFAKCRKELYEINNQVILKAIFDLLNIKLSIPFSEVERIIWENSSNVVAVEGTRELLKELRQREIRTAVISNLDFSGYLLEERLNQLFPDNQFEFVIASSDYGIRKPQSLIFEIGITKSGLAAEDIWYVGDKTMVDGIGSKSVGMTPIIFKSKRNHYDDIPEGIISIESYQELIELLNNN
ncbi:MAG: HAD family hydrolase [Erysipelotrichales bacterium]|nr:HAD family hydrolase [Erysipelotrichales bacterium]